MEYIMAFGSPHRALRAESILKGADVLFRLLPAPKILAEHCDLVISVGEGALKEALVVLEAAEAGPKFVFKKEGKEYVEV